jgi:stalled ribosome rescue protein Dom34
MHPLYFWIMILVSLYHAIRALLEQMQMYANAKYKQLAEGKEVREPSKAFKIIYSYIQEILFKFIISASGFIALLIANYIFSSVKSISEIGVGTAIILIFLIFWRITGISGYLTYLIVSGKLPYSKIA